MASTATAPKMVMLVAAAVAMMSMMITAAATIVAGSVSAAWGASVTGSRAGADGSAGGHQRTRRIDRAIRTGAKSVVAGDGYGSHSGQ